MSTCLVFQMSKRKATTDMNPKKFKLQRQGALTGQNLISATQLDKRYALKSDIETKYLQFNFPTTAFATTGGPSTSWVNAIGSSIFIPVLGDEINMRQGRQVELKTIRIHGQIDCPPDTTNTLGTAPFIRIIVADLVAAKGQTPLPAQLMSSNGVYAFQNVDSFGQWRVLKDKIIQLPYMASTESSAVAGSFLNEGYSKSFKITHKFKEAIKVKFTNIDGEVAGAISEHNIIVVAMASTVLNNPRMTFSSRCSYKDA